MKIHPVHQHIKTTWVIKCAAQLENLSEEDLLKQIFDASKAAGVVTQTCFFISTFLGFCSVERL